MCGGGAARPAALAGSSSVAYLHMMHMPASRSRLIFETVLLTIGTTALESVPHMLSRRNFCAAVVLDARQVLVICGGGGGGGGDVSSLHLATMEILSTR